MAATRAYIDYNASAPLLAEARQAMLASLDDPGNASSVHREGRVNRAVLDTARSQIAELCGAQVDHVIFTSGATESAASLLTSDYRMGRAHLPVGHLYVLASDHPCLLSGGQFDADQVTVLPVDGDGVVDLNEMQRVLTHHDSNTGTALVACHMANNETGVVQPIAAIANVVKEVGGLFVVDAVQAAGRLPIDLYTLGADFLILSSHKIGGPQGAGAIVATSDLVMPTAMIKGGGQEKGHRAGTENVAAIAGFGAAALVARQNLDHVDGIRAMRDRFEAILKRHVDDVIIVAQSVERLINTSLFVVPGLRAETAQIAFDLAGVALSAGSACSSGRVGDSHVLAAMGMGEHGSGLRLSIGADTGEKELELFEKAVCGIAARRSRTDHAA